MQQTVAVLLVLALYGSAGAATFTVDTTTDAPDADTSDMACATATNACSLRAAIQQANALAGPDTITLPAGTYLLTIGGNGEDFAATGDLDVTEEVTINGAGPAQTIVDASQLPALGRDRVFDVGENATITGLTIAGGKEFSGGGILALPYNATLTLTLRDVQLTANEATHGGGIFVDGGAIVVLDRVGISTNTGTTSGGAIENMQGSVSAANVTMSANPSGQNAIANADTLDLQHVTIKDDTIGGVDVTAGTTTVARSIFDAGPSATVCVAGTFVSQGGNVDRGTACGFAGAGDQSGVDPLLGPLQDNGGGTLTHALDATSPAVDAAAGCPPPLEDQRGKMRPLDGDLDGTAACDAGAYELDPGEPPTTTTTTTSTTSTTIAPGCPTDTTFSAVRCRLTALSEDVTSTVPAGSFQSAILTGLGKAGDRLGQAETTAPTSAKKAKKLLAKAATFVKKARAKIGSRKGRKTITDTAARTALQTEADTVRSAILALRGTL